ncbi:phosphoribosylanthranilate isomerase [uncultured Dokdonia sp.]|uniref:phosphoribosylanthranilate isomerase n=1 Tax=uncultured Dokdonia sp. TaxID=575653 RepID=UPI0026028363|nr:phosphoribosylanthranilate isomerase [uncultured Dokdonia sp.]
MKYNTQEVAALQPDYLGFIFYEGSPRHFDGEIPLLPKGVKKVGVFVDAEIAFAKANIEKYNLDIIQLHGNESLEYIEALKTVCQAEPVEALRVVSSAVEIWKVFSIKDSFDFNRLTPYESLVDAFLFDTKGKAKGGNGYTFDWQVLKDYPSQTPFILSGGIGLEEIENIKEILGSDLPILALDVNSKFEDKPGLKNIKTLTTFTFQLTSLLERRD